MTSFDKGNNKIEIHYEMIDRPVRQRATNFVRRWELLQLEDQTEHLFQNLVDELQSMVKFNLSPDGVARLAADYYDDQNGTSVSMGLHSDHHKFANLSLAVFLKQNTSFYLHSILMEFEVIAVNAIKLKISLYVAKTE